MDSKKELLEQFEGRKAKWLPLFRRLAARFSKIPGLELSLYRRLITIGRDDDTGSVVGVIRISPRGLQLGLPLAKAALKSPRLRPIARKTRGISHQVVIAEASEIDAELLEWIKVAQRQVRIAKRRST